MLGSSEQQQSILKQAIEDALSNHFHWSSLFPMKKSSDLKDFYWVVDSPYYVTLYYAEMKFDPDRDWGKRVYSEEVETMIPVEQILYNREFAKALWGIEDVDDAGHSLTAIAIWAKQVAIEHAGKVYEVDTSVKRHSFAVMPKIDFKEGPPLPTDMVEAFRVDYELKDMAGQVPFKTHRITEVSVVGGQPAYLFHMGKMAASNDPIEYIGKTMKYN